MTRPSASLALLAFVFSAFAGAELPPEALEALPVDDACAADPGSEECSASFRQLRGLQKRADAAEHVEQQRANASESEDLDAEPGVCCFSGEDSNDVCGTCFPTAIASKDDAQCSSKKHCGGCGGTWCRSVCVMGAADPSRKCETAFDTGIAEKDSFCAKNEETCGSCNGAWCKTGTKKIAVRKANSTKPQDTARAAVAGFCCYRAEDDDMCGDCADVAADETCSTEANCGTCGGTWCAGPKCVIGFADPAKPCTSAFPEGGVADGDSYCAKNEADCGNCNGHWCDSASIKYVGGEKDEAPADDSERDDEPADEEPEEPGERDEEPADDFDDVPPAEDVAPGEQDETTGDDDFDDVPPAEGPAPGEQDETTGDEDGDAPPAEDPAEEGDEEAGDDEAPVEDPVDDSMEELPE